jgi:hypothetical protein
VALVLEHQQSPIVPGHPSFFVTPDFILKTAFVKEVSEGGHN